MKDNTKLPTPIVATTNATDIWNIIFLDKYSTKTAGRDTEMQLLPQHCSKYGFKPQWRKSWLPVSIRFESPLDMTFKDSF